MLLLTLLCYYILAVAIVVIIIVVIVIIAVVVVAVAMVVVGSGSSVSKLRGQLAVEARAAGLCAVLSFALDRAEGNLLLASLGRKEAKRPSVYFPLLLLVL